MFISYKSTPQPPHHPVLGHPGRQLETSEEQGQLLALLLELATEDARQCTDIIDYVETDDGLQEVPTAGFVKANAFDERPRSLCHLLQALSQSLSRSPSSPNPLFRSQPITLLFTETILEGEALAAILVAEIVTRLVQLFGSHRFPNFLTAEFAEVISLRLKPSDPELCEALIRLLAAIASRSPAVAQFAPSVLKVLHDRPPIRLCLAGALFLLEMVRLRPAFGTETNELLGSFLAASAPVPLKAVVLEIFLVEADAGVVAVGADTVNTFLADESHEIVALALKLAGFAFRETPIGQRTFEIVFQLLGHPVESVKVHAAAALGKLAPAVAAHADMGAVLAALIRFRQRAGFAGRQTALVALMSVTSAMGAGLLLEQEVLALVPDALRLLADEEESIAPAAAAWLRAVFQTGAAAGRGEALAAVLAEFRAGDFSDFSDGGAEILNGLAALVT
jgi:hypothetical protein